MTLSKLAKLANVSVSVASKAFAGKDDVSDEMRERVFRTAKENGCFYQFYKAPYNHRVIAILIPESISEFYIRYVEGLKRLIEARNYTMLLSISNFDDAHQKELIRYYVEYCRADALIAVSDAEFPKDAQTVCLSITMDDSVKKAKSGAGITVDGKFQEGVDELLGYLERKGCRKIAYIGEKLTSGKGNMIRRLMQARGLEVRDEWFYTARGRFADAGMEGIRQLLTLDELPDAVLCAYGYITQGALRALREAGIAVPERMSLVSLGNDPDPIDTETDVTYLESDVEEICRMAMEAIYERLETGGGNSPERLRFSFRIHEGETVADRNQKERG